MISNTIDKLAQLHFEYATVKNAGRTTFMATFPNRVNREIPIKKHVWDYIGCGRKISLPCFGLVSNPGSMPPIEAISALSYAETSLYDACAKSNFARFGCSVPPLKSNLYSNDMADMWMNVCRAANKEVREKEENAYRWMTLQERTDFERAVEKRRNEPFQQFLIDRQLGTHWQSRLPLDMIEMIEKFTL